jgi:5'-3' exonuclease
MGVLRLFRYYLNKYGIHNFTTILRNGENTKLQPDVLLLDANAIFHPCCREIYEPESAKRFLRPTKLPDPETLKLRAFENIAKKIESLVKISNPKRCVYIAVDGTAGCSKQNQQRKRRFVGGMTRVKSGDLTKFDFANITAGTQFMNELDAYLVNWIGLKTRGDWINLKVVFNGVNIVGEGEHKLLHWIGKNPKYKSFCVYSPDADLLMLCMLLEQKNLTVLRENIYNDVSGDYIIVLIDKLKSLICNELSVVEYRRLDYAASNNIPLYSLEDWDHQRIIKDYVLFLFLLGNDFLPTVNSLDIGNQGIDILLKVYSDVLTRCGYLLTKDLELNKDNLLVLISLLAEQESMFIVQKYLNTRTQTPDMLVRNNLDYTTTQPVLDYNKYRTEFYRKKLEIDVSEGERSEPENKLEQLCSDYITGLQFVIHYYTKGIPSYKWYYAPHYAPLFCDLKEYLTNAKSIAVQWKFEKPLHPLENLISVLPPSSFDILPIEIREYMKDRAKMDEAFSEEFEIDYDGKREEYEGIPLIKSLEYDKAKMLLKKFKLKIEHGVEREWVPKRI